MIRDFISISISQMHFSMEDSSNLFLSLGAWLIVNFSLKVVLNGENAINYSYPPKIYAYKETRTLIHYLSNFKVGLLLYSNQAISVPF